MCVAHDPPSLPTLVGNGCVVLVIGVVGGGWGVGVGDGRSCGGERVENRWKCVWVEWDGGGSCGGSVVWGRVCVRLHAGGSVSGGVGGCVWGEWGG